MPDRSGSGPKASREIFLGHHWAVVVVSLFFVVFRICVRLRYFHRIWVDDMMVISAWILILAITCIYQSQITNLYENNPLVTGQMPPTATDIENARSLLRAEVVEMYLFYTCLWTVKLSMLVFFRRLFWDRQHAPYLKAWWWFVTVFTVSSWGACLGTIPYDCHLKPLWYILEHCGVKSGIEYVWINLRLGCATDIVSDIFIITIPMLWIRDVQVSRRNKLALVAIFSLTVITILFAIIRIAVQPNKEASSDVVWRCLWAHVEAGVTVIVACLASFRQLFVKSDQMSKTARKRDSRYNYRKYFSLRKEQDQFTESSLSQSILPFHNPPSKFDGPIHKNKNIQMSSAASSITPKGSVVEVHVANCHGTDTSDEKY